MAVDLTRVQPPLKVYPPKPSQFLLKFIRLVVPFWLWGQCGIKQIETRYIDRLVNVTKKFQDGKSRCLLAFRHPTTDDPFAMLYLLAYAVPEQAKEMGIKLRKTPHSGFVYDRGISLWAGEYINWLFPALGGISIFRGKLDRPALNLMRKQITNGKEPLSMAPEGGTNGKSEMIAELEPGIAQIGFWSAEDLQKEGRTEEMLIVPVGIQYEYSAKAWVTIDQTILTIEKECGITKPEITSDTRYQRLYDLGSYLVQWVSDYYKNFYGNYASNAPEITDSDDLATRIQNLADRILRVAEMNFGIKSKGTAIDRCRRLEQATWDRIFRNDIKGLTQLTQVERSFADQLALEANYSNWHMKIAESIIGVTSDYVRQHPSPSRYVEVLKLMWSVLYRVTERNPDSVFKEAPNFGDRKLIISVAEPLSVSDRLSEYQSSRTAAKECTRKLTEEISNSLNNLIVRSTI
ncbi:MAG: 1-acyl-sn-glycerol-3-phosphate acyltransferase [Pseudanabaena sp. M158S2SP1A06QC]|nr:1-acyl-sn-glycerol-3-phosphate acyltransferase [Pseudanabaena sp. M109S1SP1A06QC]MCA6612546.1 1-acyl-sn-glycerol-3-phosphate acyltransferase [Pseudanabaena sp. M158S2SP1A06QC]MCA6613708.1 1-acyl-sn-glycerol-3-phosphate acyltransferase [Pseudanabaena sp. M090S1SP1A06QC]MCA6621182.1 1-acyl-sn-glycerol-3-phosphate acyltransferase [Pseudanabaena sp. M165S2SP1A06QC]